MNKIKGLTYKQLLLLKGISFIILLVSTHYFFNMSIIYLFLYVPLFILRYVFSYNLEKYKFKLCPLWHFTDYIFNPYKLERKEIFVIYGTEEGTEEYKLKTSDNYTFSLISVSIISFFVLMIYLFNSASRIITYLQTIKGLDFGLLFLVVLLGILLVIALLFFINLHEGVKKARVKDQLKG